jgi:hypothetical protein
MLDNADSRRVNQTGIGLGLLISQNLLKYLNQGREEFNIKVKSEWKKGSCFEFILLPYRDQVHQVPATINKSFILTSDIDENSMLKEVPRSRSVTIQNKIQTKFSEIPKKQ